MTYLIGTDEAGYGPNLGPLVISATLWRCPPHIDGDALYDHLPGITRQPARDSEQGNALAIGDSKTLYKPGGGLFALERAVLAAIRVTMVEDSAASAPAAWRAVWHQLAPDWVEPLNQLPWYREFDAPVPVDASDDDVQLAFELLRVALNHQGVKLLAMRSCVAFPEQFNDRVARLDSKAEALSRWTLELVRSMMSKLPEGSIVIQCDKHGSRNYYAPLLHHTFPEQLVQVRCESNARSVYCWGPPERRVEARFVAKGESFLPAALASMTSKYLREMAMRAFNAFWLQQVPGLKPTAGYPADAKRFRREIQAAQGKLAIPDQQLWRER